MKEELMFEGTIAYSLQADSFFFILGGWILVTSVSHVFICFVCLYTCIHNITTRRHMMSPNTWSMSKNFLLSLCAQVILNQNKLRCSGRSPQPFSRYSYVRVYHWDYWRLLHERLIIILKILIHSRIKRNSDDNLFNAQFHGSPYPAACN